MQDDDIGHARIGGHIFEEGSQRLDAARHLSNAASGAMGLALARAAARRGAQVHLVCGPTQLPMPAGLEPTQISRVRSCADMLAACQAQLPASSVLLMAAAPADFAPAVAQGGKQKKATAQTQLELVPTADILQTLQARTPNRLVLGFAAETEALEAHGWDKLRRKDLDLLVANPIDVADAGFASPTNRGLLLRRDGSSLPLPLMAKEALAERILDEVESVLRSRLRH